MPHEFDLSQRPIQDGYKLLQGTVYPRPVAFVTTLNADGGVNAAPIAFFNGMSYDPLLVALGLEARPDGSLKDTARNISERGEFVVNVVSADIAERMNVCALDLPPGVDELAEAGLTTVPSAQVAPPRIAEAPAWLECRRHMTIELGPRRHIVLGHVIHIAVRDGAVDPENCHVDMDLIDAVGRGAGAQYVYTRDRFDMPRLDLAQWLATDPRRRGSIAQE